MLYCTYRITEDSVNYKRSLNT